MASIGDRVFDNGLGVLNSEGEEVVICSNTEPTSYAEANATYRLGGKTSPSIATPTDRAGGGREAVVTAITDGSITADGTAGYWAIVDNTNSRLLAVGALASTQGVSNGNTFTLTEFTVGIPDPA